MHAVTGIIIIWNERKKKKRVSFFSCTAHRQEQYNIRCRFSSNWTNKVIAINKISFPLLLPQFSFFFLHSRLRGIAIQGAPPTHSVYFLFIHCIIPRRTTKKKNNSRRKKNDGWVCFIIPLLSLTYYNIRTVRSLSDISSTFFNFFNYKLLITTYMY